MADLCRPDPVKVDLANMVLPRGTIKSFREYLNARFRMDNANWRHNQFRQISREYGDYLYHQDRAMFDACLRQALSGDDNYADWSGSPLTSEQLQEKK